MICQVQVGRPSIWCRPMLGLFLLVAILPLSGGRGAPAPGETSDSTRRVLGPGVGVEVRFTDGSVFKFKVLDERLTLRTPYGKLHIPLTDINHIQFATRIPSETAKRIRTAIADLASTEFKKRESATAELLELKEKAYSALLEIEEKGDMEVKRRAERVLEAIRKSIPEEDLHVRKHDVVLTRDSKIAGWIDVAAFKASTIQFGEVQLKLSDARSLRALTFQAEDHSAGDALPDPGHLYAYQPQVGRVLTFRITGGTNGSVWGTDTYTLDSNLSLAAVHAGLVKPGKVGIVKVKILGPQVGFVGSIRNGVSTSNYANYPGAYQFVK